MILLELSKIVVIDNISHLFVSHEMILDGVNILAHSFLRALDLCKIILDIS